VHDNYAAASDCQVCLSVLTLNVCGMQAPYGWPAALGLAPPSAAAGLFTADHQASSALGAKVPTADVSNKRSPDLQQRLHCSVCVVPAI